MRSAPYSSSATWSWSRSRISASKWSTPPPHPHSRTCTPTPALIRTHTQTSGSRGCGSEENWEGEERGAREGAVGRILYPPCYHGVGVIHMARVPSRVRTRRARAAVRCKTPASVQSRRNILPRPVKTRRWRMS
uniref:Uncharacterized protein n=1 Tax=Cacopsylla melanoneura TaxID=428564 RepID=A0A8D8V6I9_9HEMI